MTVYNTDKQTIEKDRKKYMFDRILDNSIDKIQMLIKILVFLLIFNHKKYIFYDQMLYDHYKNKFDSKRRRQIEVNLNNIREIKIAFFNDRIKKEVFKKINLISYNNKELVKRTWNGKHKLRPELTFEEDLELPPTDSENESTDESSDDELSDGIIVKQIK